MYCTSSNLIAPSQPCLGTKSCSGIGRSQRPAAKAKLENARGTPNTLFTSTHILPQTFKSNKSQDGESSRLLRCYPMLSNSGRMDDCLGHTSLVTVKITGASRHAWHAIENGGEVHIGRCVWGCPHPLPWSLFLNMFTGRKRRGRRSEVDGTCLSETGGSADSECSACRRKRSAERNTPGWWLGCQTWDTDRPEPGS
jgi:hypothetical protein